MLLSSIFEILKRRVSLRGAEVTERMESWRVTPKVRCGCRMENLVVQLTPETSNEPNNKKVPPPGSIEEVAIRGMTLSEALTKFSRIKAYSQAREFSTV